MMRPQRARIILLTRPLGDAEPAGEVGVEHAGEVVVGHAQHEHVGGDAGVGHEDLDRAELGLDRGEGGLDLARRR